MQEEVYLGHLCVLARSLGCIGFDIATMDGMVQHGMLFSILDATLWFEALVLLWDRCVSLLHIACR